MIDTIEKASGYDQIYLATDPDREERPLHGI